MSGQSFYQILGVGRGASADEIRSAYRELVKRHHPDLFADASAKAAATEKLGQINEAYAVLGNTERRPVYDRELDQRRKPDSASTEQARRTRRRRAPGRGRPQSRPGKAPKATWRVRFSKKWAGYGLAVAAASLLFFFATRSEPSLVNAWLLMEKLEVSPAQTRSTSQSIPDGWTRVGDYRSISECIAILKQKVAQDEREGSRSVYGDRNGTMAITMFLKAESSRPESANPEDGAVFDTKTMTKRVRTLQCRLTQRVKMESWFRRRLNRIGQSQ